MNQPAIAMALPDRGVVRSPTAPDIANRMSRLGAVIRSSRIIHLIALACLLTFCCHDVAFAQTGGGTGSLTTFLTNVVNLLTGALGQAIAVIAVAGVGIAWALGQASPRFALGTVVGVAILFSAAWIVGQIDGNGTGG
jgi:type IV secretion system protein VirB2